MQTLENWAVLCSNVTFNFAKICHGNAAAGSNNIRVDQTTAGKSTKKKKTFNLERLKVEEARPSKFSECLLLRF